MDPDNLLIGKQPNGLQSKIDRSKEIGCSEPRMEITCGVERFCNAVRETFDGNRSISYHGRTVKEFVEP